MSHISQLSTRDGCLRKDIKVHRYVHDVNRYGMISKLVLVTYDEDGKEEFFPIADDLPDTIYVSLMTLSANQEISLYSMGLEDNELKYAPDLGNIGDVHRAPKCYRCDHELEASLGQLYCNNEDCPDRIESRLTYFLSVTGCPIDFDQLYDVAQYVQGKPSTPLMIPDVIMPLDPPNGSGDYVFYGKTRYYLQEYATEIAQWLHHCHSTHIYIDQLVHFATALSIPGVTAQAARRILLEAIEAGEGQFFFTRLTTIAEVPGDRGKAERGTRCYAELLEIESRCQYYYFKGRGPNV